MNKVSELIKKVPPFINKKPLTKVIIIIVAVVILGAVFIFLRGSVTLTKTYDLKQDYCGQGLDAHYCQCAFEGELCETVGLGKDAAYRLVVAGFEEWVNVQKSKECVELGGNWKNDNCRK